MTSLQIETDQIDLLESDDSGRNCGSCAVTHCPPTIAKWRHSALYVGYGRYDGRPGVRYVCDKHIPQIFEEVTQIAQ